MKLLARAAPKFNREPVSDWMNSWTITADFINSVRHSHLQNNMSQTGIYILSLPLSRFYYIDNRLLTQVYICTVQTHVKVKHANVTSTSLNKQWKTHENQEQRGRQNACWRWRNLKNSPNYLCKKRKKNCSVIYTRPLLFLGWVTAVIGNCPTKNIQKTGRTRVMPDSCPTQQNSSLLCIPSAALSAGEWGWILPFSLLICCGQVFAMIPLCLSFLSPRFWTGPIKLHFQY